jgi:release factor glutamine methyltransferase
VENPLLDAACLLEAASGLPRWGFILEAERSIAGGVADRFISMLLRREAREPIAYILRTKEFWSLSLAVGYGVLIPRPETETLVEAVLEKIRFEFGVSSFELKELRVAQSCCQPETRNCEPGTRNPELRIVDIGTGCGAIALALATEIPFAHIYALDRSRDALRIAGRNATTLGLSDRIHLLEGDLFEPLLQARGQREFDVIVSNPPYIPSDALVSLPPEIIAYEPLGALDGGPDGLRYYRRIIEEAPDYLRAGGWLVLEVGEGQSPAVVELIRGSDAFGPAEVRKDLGGRNRVVLASRGDEAGG